MARKRRTRRSTERGRKELGRTRARSATSRKEEENKWMSKNDEKE